MHFSYLLDKIRRAPHLDDPFRHIQINDFFSAQDFQAIISSPEVAIPRQVSDENLFEALTTRSYKPIPFPGCITDKAAYLAWHQDKRQTHRHNNTSCEGFGVTVRLMKPASGIIGELMTFLESSEFQGALADKFDIDRQAVTYDAGIQKYLDGYEISPHPDVRKKAPTFMANINPGDRTEAREHHTHYLKFRDAYKYVQAYWEGNPDQDRCWVPWDWCETKKMQRENNSIVIFSPGNDTLHGVKASYDHLAQQRTQLYGNLWYHRELAAVNPAWENFVIGRTDQRQQRQQRQQRTLKGWISPT